MEALARSITFIIGNRVFDLRRRRIYGLEQLQQTLLERGITQEESFQLFAILNDNWAFANRATLTHGNRFSYGLSSSSNGFIERFEEQEDTDRNLEVEVGGFAEYTRAVSSTITAVLFLLLACSWPIILICQRPMRKLQKISVRAGWENCT